MVEQSIWMQKVAANPGHSHWYVERFRSMARAGDDLAGEARLVDAMAPREARTAVRPVVGHTGRGWCPGESIPATVAEDDHGPALARRRLSLRRAGLARPRHRRSVACRGTMALSRVQVLGRLRALGDGRAAISAQWGGGPSFPGGLARSPICSALGKRVPSTSVNSVCSVRTVVTPAGAWHTRLIARRISLAPSLGVGAISRKSHDRRANTAIQRSGR